MLHATYSTLAVPSTRASSLRWLALPLPRWPASPGGPRRPPALGRDHRVLPLELVPRGDEQLARLVKQVLHRRLARLEFPPQLRLLRPPARAAPPSPRRAVAAARASKEAPSRRQARRRGRRRRPARNTAAAVLLPGMRWAARAAAATEAAAAPSSSLDEPIARRPTLRWRGVKIGSYGHRWRLLAAARAAAHAFCRRDAQADNLTSGDQSCASAPRRRATMSASMRSDALDRGDALARMIASKYHIDASRRTPTASAWRSRRRR